MKLVNRRKFSDEQILAALLSSASVKEAARRLNMARSALGRRCREGDLLVALEDCVLRGEQRIGRGWMELAAS